MSATQDKSQKTAFVYSNLYQIYKKGKAAAQAAPSVVSPLAMGTVLKSEDLREPVLSAPQVKEYTPAAFLTRRPQAEPAVIPSGLRTSFKRAEPMVATNSNPAIESLKQNLKQLNDLHARLRFMLKEIEDLTKE